MASLGKVNVAEYLYIRLMQLGCSSLHGLPGDFNLSALDFMDSTGIKWVGSCNELNAAYAADAYARVRGLGAVMTTFGVGELSALNGIAGAYAELAPVVHIVGTPSRASQAQGALLHHTLGNGDFRVFADIFSKVTVAQANIRDPLTAPADIDRVLQKCYTETKPVYIELPVDMVTHAVDATLLDQPIDISMQRGDPEAEDAIVDMLLQKLYAAERPVFLIDGAAERRRLMPTVKELLDKLRIPVFVAPMGKGAVDESLPYFAGLYAGDGSSADVKQSIESSDMVITIGNIKSDLNTLGFTYKFSKLNTINLHWNLVDFGFATFTNVSFHSLIPLLTTRVDPEKLRAGARATGYALKTGASLPCDDTITHEWLWKRVSSFLQEDDILVVDTGTSYIGVWETTLPKNVQVISQILWSSIGYGCPAAQGAAIAAKDVGKGQRTICFEGDGSFQLTAQEIATIIRHDLDVTMFLIENEGYTIERMVHNPANAHYNDIPQWQYSKLPEVFAPADASAKVKSWRIESRTELDRLLDDPAFKEGKGLKFVEIHMPKLDAPEMLRRFGDSATASA
ncbi:pyruvate decarboxylase [Hortaea werneckii]|nr:pyruvate decarboxylase [Hortaea werneckii]